jgi:phosphohistidine swiveling domain-containing protein
MKPYIIWLREAGDGSFARMGSKAANLSRLCRNGFPVPDAFCITTDAFEDVLLFSGNSNRHSDGQEHKDALLSMHMPAGLMGRISEAYRSLVDKYGPGTRVAVRSSALAEDLADASFAGQYLSVLNVDSEEKLLLAVKQCWSSSYSNQVRAYQSHYKRGIGRPAMAVIIQAMISAEMAGVLFTTDPSGRDYESIVIETAKGLGNGIAAGTETGVRLTANRETLKITKAANSTQQIDAEFIEQAHWTPLLKLALQIESFLHVPQDIEWAFGNQRFWILQSRPITGVRRQTPRQIWTRANAGEILPGVVTPLTWSVFKPTLMLAGFYKGRSLLTLHWNWHHPSGSWPDSPRLFSGRAYMELASVYAGFCSLPGIDKYVLERLLGFEFHICREDELPAKRPRWHIMDPVRCAFYWLEILGITRALSRKSRLWTDDGNQVRCAGPGGNFVDNPKAALQHIDGLIEEAARVLCIHIQCTSMAFSAFGLIHKLIRKNVGAEDAREFEIQMTGDFHEMTTVEQGVAIWDLAQAAAKDSEVRNALFARKSAAAVIKEWRECPGAKSFLELWNSFLCRFGHRGTEEFELGVAHWDEDPSIVLQMMRDIIKHGLQDPGERMRRRRKAALRETRSMLSRVSSNGSYWETVLFRRLVDVYYRMVELRENMKYSVVGRFNALRKMFVIVGDTLRDKGLIAAREDIFFLQYREIQDLVESGPGRIFDVMSRVSERRKTYEENKETMPSDIWMSSDGHETPLKLFSSKDSTVLEGIGCSPGQITGIACVLTSVQENVAAEKGRILVAPSIDPGLTPLFLSAIGVVTEIGGILSHGATVAREYGLPAVVGVPDATRIIQNGQQITVDGSTGLIHLGPVTG